MKCNGGLLYYIIYLYDIVVMSLKIRKERGPKYYRWNDVKKEYQLRKPYECGDDPENPGGKIIPLGLKNILVEQNKWEPYVAYFEEKRIPYRIFDDLPKKPAKTQKKRIKIVDKLTEQSPQKSPGATSQKNRVSPPKRNTTRKIKIVRELPIREVSIAIPGLPINDEDDVSTSDAPSTATITEDIAPAVPPTLPEPPAPVPEVVAENDSLPESSESPTEAPAPFIPFEKSDFLYPELEDKEFNVKLAKHKEFFDTKYDGKIYDIKSQADILCHADFELMPHQIFVKNFMSFNTPYNSLLMYFGLGSGKTCAAIGVAEETRTHMKQIGMNKSIFIVASPNVQDNFRLQLFDENRLKLENGVWTIQSCVGEALLSEINPTYLKTMKKDRIVNQIKSIISEHYVFMGYTQFANFIQDSVEIKGVSYTREEKDRIKKQKIRSVFNNRLIIIDEVHNIRITRENKNKKTAELLMDVVKHADNTRLLLLSATPMYNSYEEIIWLTNLMNLNDKRGTIKISDVFNKDGDFHEKDEKHPESGKELLTRKLTGYVSYVRGENPYSFPFRVYPEGTGFGGNVRYPTLQMNGKPMDPQQTIKYLPLFLTTLRPNGHQQRVYDYVIKYMRTYDPTIHVDIDPSQMDSFGYIALQRPLEALNMTYPWYDFEQRRGESTPEEEKYLISNMLGSQGLANTMSYKEMAGDKPLRYNYEYRDLRHGRIFSPENIGNYSSKIAQICEMIQRSQGIVLVYSQWIDAGLVPLALALEEMGFTRYGSETHTKPLFKDPPVEPIDAMTMKPKSEALAENGTFHHAKYVMITGDMVFSPNNDADLKYLNAPRNRDGKYVKVVLISKAAGEGVDFKNIRQIHVMEPWFNMNRIEQIIGRGVRNLSHCQLPFEQRNVEIYLHSIQNGETETADLYIYRLAEKKSVKIGQVTRLLKETAVDCILNVGQTNFTAEKLRQLAKNNVVTIQISSGKTVEYTVGDKPFTEICDYMASCEYQCSPNVPLETLQNEVTTTTYNEDFLQGNRAKIMKRIRDLFRDIPGYKQGKHFFREDELIRSVNIVKEYPIEQIYAALTAMIDNQNELLLDRYGRLGRLINHGEYYAFQPIEITDKNASIYDRSRPVDVKPAGVTIELSEQKETATSSDTTEATTVVPQTTLFREVFKEITENYRLAFLKNVTVTTGEKNWYKNMSVVINHLIEQHAMSLENLQRHVIYHILDEMPFSQKKVVLNTIYAENWKPIDNIDTYMKEFFDERILVSERGLIGITLSNGNAPPDIFVQREHTWEKAEFTETNALLRSQNYRDKNIFNKNRLNQIIGFMAWIEGQQEYTFKIRDLNDGVNKKGARVNQALTKDLITKINQILGEQMYTTENVKTFFGDGKNRLVVVLECLIRDFQRENREDKLWYLTHEQVLLNGILNYSRKN